MAVFRPSNSTWCVYGQNPSPTSTSTSASTLAATNTPTETLTPPFTPTLTDTPTPTLTASQTPTFTPTPIPTGPLTIDYTYDANGSLISDGVKTFTNDSANRLIQVSDQSSVVTMDYNGLGQRLSMDAAGVIAHYVMDGDQPLTADSAGNTTFYLYGLGAIAEKTNAWSYSLPDGTNTPRQVSE